MDYFLSRNSKHCIEKNAHSIYLSLLDMHLAGVYGVSMQPDYNYYIRRPGATEESLRAHVAGCGVF
jgi:hypothetical protein